MNTLKDGRVFYTAKDIAVIIPAYNCEKTILRCLDSIFTQSIPPEEVIIINDGSTDRTEQVLMESPYWQKVRYYAQRNAGPATARNKGIELCSTIWAAFMDADDVWTLQTKLQEQLVLANRYADASLIDTYAKVNWHGRRELTINRDKEGAAFSHFLIQNVVNATSSVLAKTQLIRKVGGFAEEIHFGEDRLLWAQLAQLGGVYTVPKIAVMKYNEIGNLTSKGEKNYAYRVELVKRLLGLTELDKSQRQKVWVANLAEFMRLAYQANNSSHYLRVYADARRLGGYQIFLTKYFPLAIYAKLFGSFLPMSRRIA